MAPVGVALPCSGKQNVELEGLESNHHYIDKFQGNIFYSTFMYGDPDIPNKGVWDKLTSISQARNAPWFLTGDFNEIIDNTEKTGGTVKPEGFFVDFRSFISERDLYDLQHSGNYLSWRGVRYQQTILCRLDRAMANCTWMENFPIARC